MMVLYKNYNYEKGLFKAFNAHVIMQQGDKIIIVWNKTKPGMTKNSMHYIKNIGLKTIVVTILVIIRFYITIESYRWGTDTDE